MVKKGVVTLLICLGLSLILLSAVNLFLIQTQKSNYDYFIAMSDSMQPVYSRGDTLKIEINLTIEEIYAADKQGSPPGDIIAIHIYEDIIVHRAVDKVSNLDGTYSFKTWGDNNAWPDSGWVHENAVIGKLVNVNPPSGVITFFSGQH